VALGVEHISAYSLIVEEGTPMAARVRRGEALMPRDEEVNAMQREAGAMLAKSNFGRYEISNYARPGYECRHNLTYWRRGDYLGLGCAAHSMLDDCRFSNPAALDGYLAGGRMAQVERLDRADIIEETVMLATRTVRGLDLNEWNHIFGECFETVKAKEIEKLKNYGLIEIEDGFLKLTTVSQELQDSVVLELMDD
jgi:oxygen-independent coproporphyrinogen-3 oxidase